MIEHRTPNIELMNQLGFPILSVVTFLPLLGALILLFVDRRREAFIKAFAFSVSLLDLLFSLRLFVVFRTDTFEMQFVEKVPWIPSIGVSYFLGVDGLSLLLVLLTTFLSAVAVLASFSIVKWVKEYMICILLLETGMVGVFVALDLLLFYVFWEGMLIPMYFLIGIWGGPRRVYATWKFILYTMAGSVLMLVGIIVLYFRGGTFDLLALYQVAIPSEVQRWLFLAFALAFAIKVPVIPFHTWLPDAHVEAPTAGSVLLAGILLKMGTYGFLRFALPVFPQASVEFAPLILFLAILGILYGAVVSMVQPDLKTLVAYSSVSHLGFVMLGIFILNLQGVQGSILQMVNHGLSTGALFLIVGMLYERRHTRMIQELGGLYRPLPMLGAFFLIVVFSSIGLPGLNGFVGEFLILVGVFLHHWPSAVLAALGVILAAVYMLWMLQRVMFGELKDPEASRLSDLTGREIAILLPVVILIIWIGVYPQPFLRRMDASVQHLLQQVQTKQVQGSTFSVANGWINGVSPERRTLNVEPRTVTWSLSSPK